MRQTSSDTLTTLLDTTVVGQPWQPHLTLGAGVDAVTGQLRATAVKPFTVTPSPSLQPEYEYSFVQSESDVQSLISASLKASYNLEGVTVSGSTSYLEEIAVSDLAVTLVARVAVQESRYALAPSYELALTPGEDFRTKYGDYFVAGYRGGSSLYVVYQCRFTSSEQRTKFSASLAADVPQVLSAEGSSSFERIAKESSASVSVRIRAQGVSSVIPDPPASGWTAGSVVSVLVPWFNSSLAYEPLESYLMAYRLIDPSLSGEVPVSPDVFAQLGYLYGRFWLARAYVRTCPDFGRRPVEDTYAKLQKTVEANQASLATDVPKIEELTAQTLELLDSLHQVQNRQAFYSRVMSAAKTEPPAGQNFDADTGQVRWGYGFQQGTAAGVVVTAESDRVRQDWHIGWREHVFSYRNSSRVLVGWDVVCNWSDGTGGDWHKVSDTIIGRSGGDVYVKSDYDRGYDWSITWYSVDASQYPPGPWTATGVHVGTGAQAPALQVLAVDDDPVAYWTPERMAAAVPVAPTFPAPPTHAGSRSLAGGPGTAVGGTPPSESDLWAPRTQPVAQPQDFPYRTVGRLFFLQDGQPRTGSAFVVHASGIMTAAHCLLMDGHRSTQIVFVPAYQDGQAPFGAWAVDAVGWPDAWAAQQVPAWDVGVGLVRADSQGRGVGDVVGWAGLRWGGVAGSWDDVGYPAQPTPQFPFDGARPWSSAGARVPWHAVSTIAKEGDMTGGASGSPWFEPGTPVVNGVQSWSEAPEARTNVGPEFAAWVGAFYHRAFPA
ncbi:trypsin-like serine peptidase [Cellulomonas iranensis]|uniref:trypsin-like serine peptidase n=1 Tax=Cellulomonas iranensis TaxID=76862 RepID=UPI000B3C3BD6|nr:hypothetical protein [Cellulomonas iranensis]